MTKRFLLVMFLLVGLFISCNTQNNKQPEEIPSVLNLFKSIAKDSLRHLLPVLDSVFIDDQRFRKYNNPDTIRKYRKEIQFYDSVNLVKIIPIIEKYGILGYNDVGFTGNLAIVMTIQHADIKTQEKYLPLFRSAIKGKKVLPSTYAMLEDRIAIKNGKMQIYGTQVFQSKENGTGLLPTIDIDNIDKRRFSVGLTESIGEYLKRFGLKWDPVRYKKNLPRLMKEHNIKD
jgi:hypothetical protein